MFSRIERWKSEISCADGRDRGAQGVLGDGGDRLAVDQDGARLHIVEPLHQHGERRFAGPRGADEADLLPGRDLEREAIQHGAAVGVSERDVPQLDRPAPGYEGPRVRPVGNGVRAGDDAQRLAHDGELLDGADQRQRQVARAVEDAEGKRADHHDLARRDAADAPQPDCPGEHRAGHEQQRQVVDDPGLLEVAPALDLGLPLGIVAAGEPVALAGAGGEGLERPHIGNGVNQLAAGGACLLGVAVVQGPAALAEQGEDGNDRADEDQQRQRHPPVDEKEDRERTEEVGAGRGDVPHQRRQYVMKGGASGRDPAGERARQLVGEVAHRLPGKVLEQVKPQVDRARDDGPGPEPARRAATARSRPRSGQ